jgi:hypothetical protein
MYTAGGSKAASKPVRRALLRTHIKVFGVAVDGDVVECPVIEA